MDEENKKENEVPETTTQDDLSLGIGTKEPESLKPAIVKVLSTELQDVNKDGKFIGKKVVCICKHPDKKDPVAISSVKFVKGNQIKNSGLWLNKDDDGLIMKVSALAILLNKVGASSIADLEGKEINTEIENGFLTLKGY